MRANPPTLKFRMDAVDCVLRSLGVEVEHWKTLFQEIYGYSIKNHLFTLDPYAQTKSRQNGGRKSLEHYSEV